MDRLMAVSGMTPAEMAETVSFIMGIIIACVFAGNMISWLAKEALELLFDMADFLINRVWNHIRKHSGKKRER